MVENGILKPDGVIQLKGGTKEVLKALNPLPARRELIIELDTGRIKAGDGVHRWNELGYVNGIQAVTEIHTLTESEASAQGFSLSRSVAGGHEGDVIIFISGVAQVSGLDFSVSGQAVNWAGLGLAEIDLRAGDRFLVQYIPAE